MYEHAEKKDNTNFIGQKNGKKYFFEESRFTCYKNNQLLWQSEAIDLQPHDSFETSIVGDNLWAWSFYNYTLIICIDNGAILKRLDNGQFITTLDSDKAVLVSLEQDGNELVTKIDSSDFREIWLQPFGLNRVFFRGDGVAFGHYPINNTLLIKFSTANGELLEEYSYHELHSEPRGFTTAHIGSIGEKSYISRGGRANIGIDNREVMACYILELTANNPPRLVTVPWEQTGKFMLNYETDASFYDSLRVDTERELLIGLRGRWYFELDPTTGEFKQFDLTDELERCGIYSMGSTSISSPFIGGLLYSVGKAMEGNVQYSVPCVFDIKSKKIKWSCPTRQFGFGVNKPILVDDGFYISDVENRLHFFKKLEA